MAQITKSLLMFLVFMAAMASTFRAQEVKKQCEYEMVVNTGPSRGPTYKLWVTLSAIDGSNINTTNVVKRWGDMGRDHVYFLPNSVDRFKTTKPCLEANFCNIMIGGKKGNKLKSQWYINNIVVLTKGDGINRKKTFMFNANHEVDYTCPPVNYGDCP